MPSTDACCDLFYFPSLFVCFLFFSCYALCCVVVNLDCSDRYFSKKVHGVDKDTKVYPFFINEAAYYEKGIAMMLGTRTTITYTILDLS